MSSSPFNPSDVAWRCPKCKAVEWHPWRVPEVLHPCGGALRALVRETQSHPSILEMS